jgi:hypothetical protein
MDQLYRVACGCGTPRYLCGSDRAGPRPSKMALSVALPAGPADAVQGRAPGLSRHSINWWIGSVGLGCPSPDRLAKTPGWHCP